MDRDGKTALVTGGAAGIGAGIAERLAAEGMDVIMPDLDREAARRGAGQLHLPGLVDTPASRRSRARLTPAQRAALPPALTPMDIAAAAMRFLADDSLAG